MKASASARYWIHRYAFGLACEPCRWGPETQFAYCGGDPTTALSRSRCCGIEGGHGRRLLRAGVTMAEFVRMSIYHD